MMMTEAPSQEAFTLCMHENRFRVTVATSDSQIEQAKQLRYRSFIDPNAQAGTLDEDEFDAYCIHLVVLDEETKRVVGTYRVLRTDRIQPGKGFYSQTEFDLSKFLSHGLKLVEVGRACVDESYRDGRVMHALWNGLGRYIILNGFDGLFGCASMHHGASMEEAANVIAYARELGLVLPEDMSVKPLPRCHMPDFPTPPNSVEPEIKRKLPALLRGYLSLGCYINDAPAYDPDFEVMDFFTFLSVESMKPGARRFFVHPDEDRK